MCKKKRIVQNIVNRYYCKSISAIKIKIEILCFEQYRKCRSVVFNFDQRFIEIQRPQSVTKMIFSASYCLPTLQNMRYKRKKTYRTGTRSLSGIRYFIYRYGGPSQVNVFKHQKYVYVYNAR